MALRPLTPFPWIIAAALLVLAGCGGQSPETPVGLGEEFTLSVGEAASIVGEHLSVKFKDIVSDSR
jgi:hypothetical protein